MVRDGLWREILAFKRSAKVPGSKVAVEPCARPCDGPSFYIDRKSKRFLFVSVATSFAAYLDNRQVSVSQYRGYIK